MVFTSLTFLIFVAIVVTIYIALPQKIKPYLLIAASLCFYLWWKMWAPIFIVIYALFNYFMAKAIASKEGTKKRIILFSSVGLSLILFFVFRYHIVDGIINAIVRSEGIDIRILFPLGFSYYMFKNISYLIDVNNKTMESVKRFDHYLLYVVYFPEVSMGPITRAVDFIPQIKVEKKINTEIINKGIVLVAWGFFKKIVFADRLASIMAPYYSDTSLASNGFAWFLLAFGFIIQLYLDFSAYTDISVGVSRMLGYDIKHNFKAPFFSYSISEFWRKWHITLFSWLSDYVFSPMQFLMRSLGKLASIIPALITFTLIGIWHGGTSTYLVFGVSMGVLVAIEALVARKRKRLKKKVPKVIFNTVTFIVTMIINVVVFLFMRVPTASAGFDIITKNIFNFSTYASELGLSQAFYILLALGVVVTICSHLIELKTEKFLNGFAKLKLPIMWTIYLLVIFVIILFGHYGPGYDAVEFIYIGF